MKSFKLSWNSQFCQLFTVTVVLMIVTVLLLRIVGTLFQLPMHRLQLCPRTAHTTTDVTNTQTWVHHHSCSVSNFYSLLEFVCFPKCGARLLFSSCWMKPEQEHFWFVCLQAVSAQNHFCILNVLLQQVIVLLCIVQ